MHSFKSSEILICKYIICPKDAGKWGTTATCQSALITIPAHQKSIAHCSIQYT